MDLSRLLILLCFICNSCASKSSGKNSEKSEEQESVPSSTNSPSTPPAPPSVSGPSSTNSPSTPPAPPSVSGPSSTNSPSTPPVPPSVSGPSSTNSPSTPPAAPSVSPAPLPVPPPSPMPHQGGRDCKHPVLFNVKEVNAVRINILGYGFCSGSFLTPSHIVTAAHCFLKNEQDSPDHENKFLKNHKVGIIQTQYKKGEADLEITAPIEVEFFKPDLKSSCNDPDLYKKTIKAQAVYIPKYFWGPKNTNYRKDYGETWDLAIVKVPAQEGIEFSKILSDPYEDETKKVFASLAGYPVLTQNKKWNTDLDLLSAKDIRLSLSTLYGMSGTSLDDGVEERKETVIYSEVVSKAPDDQLKMQSFSGAPIFSRDSNKTILGTVRMPLCLTDFSADNCFLGAKLGQVEHKVQGESIEAYTSWISHILYAGGYKLNVGAPYHIIVDNDDKIDYEYKTKNVGLDSIDINEILRFDADIFSDDIKDENYYKDRIDKTFSGNPGVAFALKLKQGSVPLGLSFVYQSAVDTLYLESIGIVSAARGRKLAKEFLDETIAKARSFKPAGIKKLQLYVKAGNDVAKNLYKRSGFAEEGGGYMVLTF